MERLASRAAHVFTIRHTRTQFFVCGMKCDGSNFMFCFTSWDSARSFKAKIDPLNKLFVHHSSTRLCDQQHMSYLLDGRFLDDKGPTVARQSSELSNLYYDPKTRRVFESR
jgi:hypothetical protein